MVRFTSFMMTLIPHLMAHCKFPGTRWPLHPPAIAIIETVEQYVDMDWRTHECENLSTLNVRYLKGKQAGMPAPR